MTIVTQHVFPPIPTRKFDWAAYDDETFDGETGNCVGYGETEVQAVRNFLDEWEERYGATNTVKDAVSTDQIIPRTERLE